MSATLALQISYHPDGPPTKGVWFRGNLWNEDDKDWTKESDYFYQWSGGLGGKLGTDSNGKKIYQFDAARGKWNINVKGEAKIREVIFCDKTAPAPKILDSRRLGSTSVTGQPLFTTYPQNGSWQFVDGDTKVDPKDTYQHHVWVWAQMNSTSPIIRCDPMVHNKG